MKKLIIVLAHPRTGSSLVMQTLKFLNVGIIGQFERNDLPQEANPKGYYEAKYILNKGLTDLVIEKLNKMNTKLLRLKLHLRV